MLLALKLGVDLRTGFGSAAEGLIAALRRSGPAGVAAPAPLAGAASGERSVVPAGKTGGTGRILRIAVCRLDRRFGTG